MCVVEENRTCAHKAAWQSEGMTLMMQATDEFRKQNGNCNLPDSFNQPTTSHITTQEQRGHRIRPTSASI
eukprot:2886328-Amphidinium_carterae.2